MKKHLDIIIVVTLALLSAVTAMVYVSTWGGTPHFFQELFGPPAMYACGHGFVNPVLEKTPGLDAFLHPAMHVNHPPEKDCLKCSEILPNTPTQPLDGFQKRQLYLLIAVAGIWSVFGVAWSSLIPLYGILYGASTAALYGIFRLGMNRLFATACTILLFLSPVQLNNLVRLRDYSKAPFILAAILIMAWLIKTRFAWWKVCLGAAIIGLLAGIGCGFRMDTLICLPACILVILFFIEGPFFRTLWVKGLALALLLGIFSVSAYPLFNAVGSGMKYQDFLLGFNDLYDSRLGVGGVPYRIHHRYLDYEPMATLHAFGQQVEQHPVFYTFDSLEYEAIGGRYVRTILKIFPADLMTRALAATLRIVDELPASPENTAPRGVANPLLLNLFSLHAQIMHYGLRYARYAVLAAILLVSLRNMRWGFAAAFLLLYFGGYGAIQFATRHYFHLQFLSIWAVGFLLSIAITTGITLYHREKLRMLRDQYASSFRHLLVTLSRPIVVSITVLLILAIPLALFSAWQTFQVRALLHAFDQAEKEPLTLTSQQQPDGRWLVQGQEIAPKSILPEPATMPFFDMEYLVAEFDTSQNPVESIALYEGSTQDLALTWAQTLPKTNSGATRLIFPVYYARWKSATPSWTTYEGLLLSQTDFSHLKALQRITNPQAFPLLITAALSPDWENHPLYQRLVR
ncbi:MAG TPA: hypothetical protein PLI09_23770 [Candidatus Hydrogenedentes bacterium]|nr:hypothetical protein [Candidatus Hydrogenedentota bacterium]